VEGNGYDGKALGLFSKLVEQIRQTLPERNIEANKQGTEYVWLLLEHL